MVAERRERAGENVEALVLLETANAEENGIVVRRGSAAAARIAIPSASEASRVDLPEGRARSGSRTRVGGESRCARTIGSRLRSVAMTQSAARAHASTARRSGR